MSGNHSDTSNHNVEFLEKTFEMTKDRVRAVFIKGKKAFFSPAVAKNSQNSYWFDIREANINFIQSQGLIPEKLIIRIVPNKFVIVNWKEFINLFENPKFEYTGSAVWSFTLEKNFTQIQNRKSKKYLNVQCLCEEELRKMAL